MIIGLGLGTLILYHFQKSVSYLKTYAIALVFLGLSIFTHSILLPEVALTFIPLIHLLYYLSCIFHSSAIYQRLQLQVNWTTLSLLLLIGLGCNTYFSLYNEHQAARIFCTGLITFTIYLHRPKQFFSYRPQFQVDHILKILTLTIASVALFRACLLFFILPNTVLISTYDAVWALTQMILIIITVTFWGLFIRCSVVDVIQRLHQERDLDPLTGLLNRRGFHEHLQRMSPPIKHSNHAILIADLDHFKRINDQYGHQIGDLALGHFSTVFQKNVRQNDVIARIGGEEFLVILNDIPSQTTLEIAERLRLELYHQPLHTTEHVIPLTVSIGISFFKDHHDFEKAFGEADQLLYQAKASGRNVVKFSMQPDTEIYTR